MNIVMSCVNYSTMRMAVIYSFIIGIAGVYAAWTAITAFPNIDLKEIGSVSAAISGTLLGFLITAFSILATILGRPLLRNMRKTGHFHILLQELLLAGIAFLIVLILAFFILFTDGEWQKYMTTFCAGSMCFALSLLSSAGNKLIKTFLFLQ